MFLLSTSLSHAPYERLHGKDKRICTAHWVIAPHDSFATSGMRHALAVDNAEGLYGHERRTLLRGTGFLWTVACTTQPELVGHVLVLYETSAKGESSGAHLRTSR